MIQHSKQYLTISQIAERFQVDEKTVSKWVRESGFPCLRMERVVRFDPQACDRWAEDRIGQATA